MIAIYQLSAFHIVNKNKKTVKRINNLKKYLKNSKSNTSIKGIKLERSEYMY